MNRNADTGRNWRGSVRQVHGIKRVKKDTHQGQVSKRAFDFAAFVVSDCPPVAGELNCKPSSLVYADVLGTRVKVLLDSDAEVRIVPTSVLDRIRKEVGMKMIRNCVTFCIKDEPWKCDGGQNNQKKESPIGKCNIWRGRRGFEWREVVVVQSLHVKNVKLRCFQCGRYGIFVKIVLRFESRI